MKSDQGLIEDVLAIGGNLLGHLFEARHEVKSQLREKADHFARRLDLVSREEFDAAFSMLAKARQMQDELSERLSVIESHLNLKRKTAKKAAKKPLPSVKKARRATSSK